MSGGLTFRAGWVAAAIAIAPTILVAQTTHARDRLQRELGSKTLVDSLPGIVEPIQHVMLSAPAEEILSEILVRESDHVRVGNAVARLDTRALRVSLRLAEAVAQRAAASHRAERQLQLAEHQLDRIRTLHAKSSATDAQLDKAAAAFESVKATVTELKERTAEALIQADIVRSAIELRTLRAPFSGQIIRIEGREGQTVKMADPILSLASLEKLRVDLHLPTSLFNRLQVGDRHELWAGAPINRIVSAKLASKEPLVSASTDTFRCSFEIKNQETRYPAGFTARLVEPSNETGARLITHAEANDRATIGF